MGHYLSEMGDPEPNYGKNAASQDRPVFADQSAKMAQRADKIPRATPTPVSVLQMLTQQVNDICGSNQTDLHMIAEALEQHADRVFGELPSTNTTSPSRGAEEAEPFYYGGQLGELQRAVDQLGSVLRFASNRLNNAAARTTGLA